MDTLQAAKTLQGAGFNQAQAEALVNTIGHAVHDNVATKTDIAEVRGEITGLRRDIAEVRGEMMAQIERTRAEVYRVMAVQTVTIVAAVVALIKLT